MTKLLKPYTIIPSELYVKRDADRQLLNVIEDMGRPGYVLVSRQMGKTNLLLNAKREAETSNDIFVYIDLSNPYASAKDCFENIIDTILEIHEDNLHDISTAIIQMRKESETIPAHKQHVSELRRIIKGIKGKLVIILDEIDALTKTTYSDRIFSQIRSIYFIRVNFPELSRLTYVLSGVVEPTDIIKDPKISPFNIGQKIFLNDFSFEEFNTLLVKANLTLNIDIVNYIYYWTSGHPRISWDVCSEIESISYDNEITIDIIDEVIRKTYLTTFDKPPIDNIRELLKNDVELRNAVIELEYNKGEAISDRIKSKLYLSGIINFTDGSIKLKNEVIKQSVSLEWINSINEEEKGLTKIALEFYDKREFKECLNAFIKYLKNNNFSIEEKSIYYYYMGYCAYRESIFGDALEYLNKTDFDSEDDTKFYYLTSNLKGLLYYYEDNIPASLEHFKSVLSRSKKDEIFARALVNFGSISLKSNDSVHINEAKDIFQNIINEKNIDTSKIAAELLSELKAISYYNLAQIESEESIKTQAINYFEKAVELAPIKTKPKIILGLIPIIKDEGEKISLLNILLDMLGNSSLVPQEFDPDSPMSFDFDQFKELVICLKSLKDKSLYGRILPSVKMISTEGLGKNLYDIALYCINKNLGLDIAIDLLEEIYNNKSNSNYEINDSSFYDTLKLISYFSNSKTEEGFSKLNEYIELYQKVRTGNVDFIDIENFANLIYTLIEQDKYTEALQYVDVINSCKSEVPEQFLINYLVIHNLELSIHIKLSNLSKSKEAAEQILLMANDNVICKQTSNMLGADGLSIIKTNAESFLKPDIPKISPSINTPNDYVIAKQQSYGRNEIVRVLYVNGKVMSSKYKNVESDIKSKSCIVIE